VTSILIKGTITRKLVRVWLDNYAGLDQEDVRLDLVKTSGGLRGTDGVSGRALTKIMVDEAIAALPQELTAVVRLRWLQPVGLGAALRASGLSKTEYYRRCDKALDQVYRSINGVRVNYEELANAILK
jgi:fimbrial chaperone protein